MADRSPLPEYRVPRENDDYTPLLAFLDSAPTTSIEAAFVQLGVTAVRPAATGWTVYPGPKTPTAAGRYLVVIRTTGGGPADEVGYLIVT